MQESGHAASDRCGDCFGEPFGLNARDSQQCDRNTDARRITAVRFRPVGSYQHTGMVRPKRLGYPLKPAPATVKVAARLRPRLVDSAAAIGAGIPAKNSLWLSQRRFVDRQRLAAHVAAAAAAVGNKAWFHFRPPQASRTSVRDRVAPCQANRCRCRVSLHSTEPRTVRSNVSR